MIFTDELKQLDRQFDALIFDCDGTLVDTMPTHFVAWREALQRYGLDHLFPEDRFYQWGGVSATVVVERLAQEAGKTVDAAAIADEKERLFHDMLETIKPIEVDVELARAYHGRLPLAVATGSPQWSARQMLQAIGILDWFDAIAAADDIDQPKPAPDVYLLAAGKLAVDPRRCLAFEDADLGIAAAKAAGMSVVDIRRLPAD